MKVSHFTRLAVLLLAPSLGSCGGSSTEVPCFGLPTFSLSPPSVALRVGETARLTLQGQCPAGTQRDFVYSGPVRWESSDSAVVIVAPSDSAEVTIVARGVGVASVIGSLGDPTMHPVSRVTVGP